jgi:hypothetical protein
MDFEKAYLNYKEHKIEFDENFRIKLHRAFSWLKQADEAPNEDLRYICLWIAFNSVYGKEREPQNIGTTLGDRQSFQRYLAVISNLDKKNRIITAIRKNLKEIIRELLENRYTFQPYWDYYNGKKEFSEWERAFQKAKKLAIQELTEGGTAQILSIVFDRLYTLRNQILHGGATCGSQINRKQLHDGCLILETIIPVVLEIMLSKPDTEIWGEPYYPHVHD